MNFKVLLTAAAMSAALVAGSAPAVAATQAQAQTYTVGKGATYRPFEFLTPN